MELSAFEIAKFQGKATGLSIRAEVQRGSSRRSSNLSDGWQDETMLSNRYGGLGGRYCENVISWDAASFYGYVQAVYANYFLIFAFADTPVGRPRRLTLAQRPTSLSSALHKGIIPCCWSLCVPSNPTTVSWDDCINPVSPVQECRPMAEVLAFFVHCIY